MPFSPAQLEAIQIRNKNVIVSASAGSGKTSVLVQRLSTLVIQDRISIDSILAMTFTNDAASEMKDRLKQDLLKQKQKNPEDAYLSNQLTLLETASICTIDSFCQNLVKTYYYKIPISLTMATTVGSASQIRKAMTKAYQRATQQISVKDYMECKLYFQSFGKKEEDIQKTIEQMIQTGQSKPHMDQWFSLILNHFDTIQEESLNWFFQYFTEKMISMIEILDSMIDKVNDMEFKKESQKMAMLSRLEKKREFNSICLKPLKEKNYDEFRKIFIASINLTENIPGTINKIKMKEKDNYLSFQKDISNVLYPWPQFINDIENQKSLVHTLISLCKYTCIFFAEEKKQQEFIDFNDMEHFALLLLEDQSIQEELQTKYNEILIDEFQDTNELQETIVSKFCRKNNVFRVGDIKQSIYGFRQAKPSIMKEHMKSTSNYDKALVLKENYRSNQSIIEFNNDFYEKLMNSNLLGTQFEEVDIAKVGMESQKDSLAHPIRFLYSCIDEIKESYDLSYPEAKKYSLVNRYHLMAKSILKDIQNGRNYKDICILLRNRNQLDDIKTCLESYSIPVFAQVTNGFFTNQAVQIVCACLSCLNNPYDDIQLIACLCSGLFEISYEQISQVCKTKKRNASLYETIKDCDFMIPFHTFRKQKEKVIPSLIRQIYRYNDFYENHTSSQDKTNLDYLLEKAVNYPDLLDIDGFILEIEEESKLDIIGQANAFGKEENVVRIMTMHASKGLQFPVVYILSSNEMKKRTGIVSIDSDLGIALQYLDYPHRLKRKSLFSLAFETKAIHEELMEEMRILYVATTRAKEELIFVDAIKSESDYEYSLNTQALLSFKSYTSWLFHIYRNENTIQFIKDNHLYEVEEKEPVNIKIPVLKYQKEESVFTSFAASQTKVKTGWPSFESNDSAMNRGTLFHEMAGLLDYPYLKEKVIQYAKMNSYVMSNKDLDQFLSLNENKLYKKWMKLNHQFELSYIVLKDEMVLHGYMDLVIFDTDITILDFKTDALNEMELVETYKEQLITYKEALQKIYPDSKISTVLYSFYLKKVIPVVESES